MLSLGAKLDISILGQHNLIKQTIVSLLCLCLSLSQADSHWFSEGRAIADKPKLKVPSILIVDFWGCVNLSKLRKQGNLA